MKAEDRDEVRILVVDDEEEILHLYRRVLGDCPGNDSARLGVLEEHLFSEKKRSEVEDNYDLTLCRQGDEAVLAMEESLAEQRPYALCFLDIRLPPGPDGIWTGEQLRLLDPMVNICLVTGYTDVTPQDIRYRLLPPGRLLYVQKPLLHLEMRQIAAVLADKWRVERRLAEIEGGLS